MPGLYRWFRTATYFGYSVMLCVFSLFLILVSVSYTHLRAHET